MIIGKKDFDLQHHTYVMGILNVTPDSFSDGGKFLDKDKALFHVEQMITDGADIIDVGGESTRPGHIQISDDEEIARVVPVIEMVKREFDIPISLDTYKGAVAKAGIDAGIDLLNDVWGLQYDEKLGALVAESKLPYCMMHNRSYTRDELSMEEFLSDVDEDINRALSYGISKEQVILDPGVGFAKTQEQNLMVIGNLNQLVAKGYPVLLGTSRKSVIGYVLDLPTDERVEGTLATTAEAVYSHCGFVRVHDVKENARFIKMLERTRGMQV